MQDQGFESWAPQKKKDNLCLNCIKIDKIINVYFFRGINVYLLISFLGG